MLACLFSSRFDGVILFALVCFFGKEEGFSTVSHSPFLPPPRGCRGPERKKRVRGPGVSVCRVYVLWAQLNQGVDKQHVPDPALKQRGEAARRRLCARQTEETRHSEQTQACWMSNRCGSKGRRKHAIMDVHPQRAQNTRERRQRSAALQPQRRCRATLVYEV